MTRVAIHGPLELREAAGLALLGHFGHDDIALLRQDPDRNRVTVPLPGATERDTREACRLYLEPHQLLHFIHQEAS